MLELYVYIRKILFMTDKKIAVIDLGTNTFHLLIVSISDGSFSVLVKERVTVKIGQNGISKGVITEDAQIRALKALIEFKKIIDQYDVSNIYATATSAIRNAKNGKQFAEKIKSQTSIDIRIISGDEEAEYIYYGVKTALSLGSETSLIMDIGGGSVEFIICNEDTIFWKKSFEIGAQRLLDLFHYHDPILKEEIIKLDKYLEDRLQPLIEAAALYNPSVLVGSSGTFDTLVEIYNLKYNLARSSDLSEYNLPLEEYNLIHEEIIHKVREERMKIPGMIEMRVEMIVVASELIRFVLNKLNLKRLRISSYSLKEGVLYKTINSIK